jgi:surface polysaccharide O-acyltransferase-like enzyme
MAEPKPTMDLSDKNDPIIAQWRQLVELARWILMFYVVYLSLLVPLFGIIVGYLLKKNAIVPGNQKLGNACMILGIIFTILICVCFVVYFVAIFAALTQMGSIFGKTPMGI